MSYQGLCAGGPADGENLIAELPTIVVPIQIPGEAGFGSGTYKFKAELGMWVWQGQWPPKEKLQPKK